MTASNFVVKNTKIEENNNSTRLPVRTRFTLGGPGIFPGRDFLFIFYMDPVFLLLFLYYSFDHIKKKKKKSPSELLMVSLSFSLFSLSLSSWAS